MANEYPGVNMVHNTAELWENDNITCIAIAAPAVLHYELAKKALLAEFGDSRRIANELLQHVMSMKNMKMAQVSPKSGSIRRLPLRGVANTKANEHLSSSSSDEDLIHLEEDHHNTVINGKKGPHEL